MLSAIILFSKQIFIFLLFLILELLIQVQPWLDSGRARISLESIKWQLAKNGNSLHTLGTDFTSVSDHSEPHHDAWGTLLQGAGQVSPDNKHPSQPVCLSAIPASAFASS